MVTLVNRAKVSTATTGTGTITLGSAESGYQTFADAGVTDAQVVRYVIEDGTDWEIGTGTYTATGTTLSRTVSESSNADAALNLSGSAVVYVSATAADLAPVLELYAENPSSPTAPSATGTNAVAIGSESVSAGLRSIALGDAYASGTDSFAAAIASNSSSYGATGANSIAMGYQAKAAGQSSAMGYGAVADGSYALALGVYAKASASSSIAISAETSGYYTEALQSNSVAIGTRAKANIRGKFAFANGAFGDNGDAQLGIFSLRSDTTDATAEALTTNKSTAGTTNQVILPNNSAYFFGGTIIARQDAASGTDVGAWEIKGAIRREANAASTVLVKSTIDDFNVPTGWVVALTADTTNGGLAITVTGAAATNIRWVATINTSEVTY
jgi:hypothetical protein